MILCKIFDVKYPVKHNLGSIFKDLLPKESSVDKIVRLYLQKSVHKIFKGCSP